MKCPNCSYEGPDDALECVQCSIVFSKWKAREERNTQPQDQSAISAQLAEPVSSVFARLPVQKLIWAGAILILVAGAASIVIVMNKSSEMAKKAASVRWQKKHIINAQKAADKAQQLNADLMLRSLQIAEEVTGKQNMATSQAVQEAEQQ